MANIKYNSDYLDGTIIPTVLSSKTSFQDARNTSNYNLPNGFMYNGLLQEVNYKISSIIEKLDRFSNWANDAKNTYNNLSDESLDGIRKIESININTRINPQIMQKSVK